MDQIDGEIIYRMIKNPRGKLRQMAFDLNISPQDLNYRLKKIMENGLVKKFMLHINPILFDKKSLYLAFHTQDVYEGKVSSVIKCFEKTTVYGLSGNDTELERKKKEMINVLGEPAMVYIPNIMVKGTSSVLPLDYRIIEGLKRNPLAKSTEIAEKIGEKTSTIERRIETLIDRKLITIIPKIDLSKLNTVILGIFSSRINEIISKLDKHLLVINDESSGLSLTIERDIYSAKRTVNELKKIDSSLEVMLIYDYDFFE